MKLWGAASGAYLFSNRVGRAVLDGHDLGGPIDLSQDGIHG